MPRLRHTRVGQVSKRDTTVGVSPAIRGSYSSMSESIGWGFATQSANLLGRSPQMGSQSSVHGHAHELVDPLSRVVLNRIGQRV